MKIDHVLAVIPVSDIDTATTWYSTLFGRAPDNNPMPVLVEWRVTDTGWVQVFIDEDRAGTGLTNFAVADLDGDVAEMTDAGLAPSAPEDASKGVRTSTLVDPDRNTLRLIGGFREEY